MLATATPDRALAGTIQIAPQRVNGDRGQWSGEHRGERRWVSPGPYWRQRPEHRERWDRGDHDGWRRHPHYYGYEGHVGGWWGPPVYVPGYWAWNGWGWVWIPGYWR